MSCPEYDFLSSINDCLRTIVDMSASSLPVTIGELLCVIQQASSQSGLVFAQPDLIPRVEKRTHPSDWYFSERGITIKNGYDPANAGTVLDESNHFNVLFTRDKLACDVGLMANPGDGKLDLYVSTFEWLNSDLSSIVSEDENESYVYDDGNGYDVMVRGRPSSGILTWLSSMPNPDPMTKRAIRQGLYSMATN